MILSALLVAASLSFDVVRDGVPACSVIASGEKSVDAAAAFFTNAVHRVSGAEIVVVESCSCRKDVANSTLPLQLDTATNRIVFDVKKAGLMEEDDWAIEFPDERTMKVTCSPRSARWALNRLVEDWGVVFCQPGPHGTHYPRRTSLACAREARRGTAALRLSRDLYVEDPEWVRALGCKSLGDVRFFNHSMHAVLPTAKYGEEPWVSDVMPERDGKRVKPRNHYSGWQPCWASETGRLEAVKNICAYLRTHPEQQTYSLSVNDLEGYCECAKCRVLNGGSFTNRCTFGFRHKKHSESYYQWVNAVAEGVRREFPDIWFGVLAYCGTIDPPSFPLNDHVVPFLCCDTYQAQDEKVMASRERLFAAWSEKASAFGLWDYAYGCRAYQAPRLYTKTMAKYFALKRKYPKLQAFFMEGDSFVGEGPKRYLFGKLISDPDCDAEAELGRWYRACCGEAAADDLRAYYDLWERFYTEGDIKKTIWYTRGITGVYMDFGQRRYVFALGDGELEKADRLMARVVAAAEASGDADQRERARRLAEWHALYHARLVASGVGCADYEGKFHAAEEVARFLAKLPGICTAHRQVAELTEKVIATRLADGGDDGRLKGHCDGFRTRQLNRTTNIVSLFNDALAFVGDPAVKRAMAAVADDARVDDLFRDSIRGLLDLSRVPNRFFPDGLSVADDLRLWTRVDHGIRPEDAGTAANGTKATRLVNEKGGWPAAIRFFPRVDTSTTYLFRARVTNESKAPLSIRMLFNTADPETAAGIGDNGGIEKIVPVKPGETKELSLFCQKPVPLKSGKPPAARLYVILNGLPQGQSAVLDSCEFRPLCSKK